jgi:hypothetical protein
MAIGNILGFAAGAFDRWGDILPFTMTTACDTPCANLKSAFLVGTIILVITTILSVTAATEIPWKPEHSKTHATHNAAAAGPLLPDKPLAGQLQPRYLRQRIQRMTTRTMNKSQRHYSGSWLLHSEIFLKQCGTFC